MEAVAGRERRNVRIGASRANGESVAVWVRDSGPGLSEDVRERLFQPFVTTKPEGTGLGLSICQTIIRAHGGTIEARAAPGGGAEFRFTLPTGEGDVDR